MSALDSILAQFEKNKGTMPQVNPPAAATVLANATAAEVAGKPEPAATPAATAASQPAPVTGSAPSATSSDAAAAETKTRRTAAVVQLELDQEIAAHAQTKALLADEEKSGFAMSAELSALRLDLERSQKDVAELSGALRQALEDGAKLSEGAPVAAAPVTLEALVKALHSLGFGIFSLDGRK